MYCVFLVSSICLCIAIFYLDNLSIRFVVYFEYKMNAFDPNLADEAIFVITEH